jgi:hypothetical protein
VTVRLTTAARLTGAVAGVVQGADTLSLQKALEGAMAKVEAARTTNN